MKKSRVFLILCVCVCLLAALFTVQVSAEGNEASFGGAEYETLAAAIAASEGSDGGTVTLLANVSTDSTITLSKTTLDLAGHTLTSSAGCAFVSTTNMTVYSSVAGGAVVASGNLTGGGVKITLGDGTQNLTVTAKRMFCVDRSGGGSGTMIIKGCRIVSATALPDSGRTDGIFNVESTNGNPFSINVTATDTVFDFNASIGGAMFATLNGGRCTGNFTGCTFGGSVGAYMMTSNGGGNGAVNTLTLTGCKVASNMVLGVNRAAASGTQQNVVLGEGTLYYNRGSAVLANGLWEDAGTDGYTYCAAPLPASDALEDSFFRVVDGAKTYTYASYNVAVAVAQATGKPIELLKDYAADATITLNGFDFDLAGHTLTSTASPVFAGTTGKKVYSSVEGGAVSAASSNLTADAVTLVFGDGTQNLTITAYHAFSTWDGGNGNLTFDGCHVIMSTAFTEEDGFFCTGGGSSKRPNITVTATDTVFDFKSIATNRGGIFMGMNYASYNAIFTGCTLNASGEAYLFSTNSSKMVFSGHATLTGCAIDKNVTLGMGRIPTSTDYDIILGEGTLFYAPGIATYPKGVYAAEGRDGYTYEVKAYPAGVNPAEALFVATVDEVAYYYADFATALTVAEAGQGVLALNADYAADATITLLHFDFDLAGHTLTSTASPVFAGTTGKKVYSSAEGGAVSAALSNLTADAVTLVFGDGTQNLTITAYHAFSTWDGGNGNLTFNGCHVIMPTAFTEEDGFFCTGGGSSKKPNITVTATDTVFDFKSIATNRGGIFMGMNYASYNATFTDCTLNASGEAYLFSTNNSKMTFSGHATFEGCTIDKNVILGMGRTPTSTDYDITLGADCRLNCEFGIATLAEGVILAKGDDSYKYLTADAGTVFKVWFVALAHAAAAEEMDASEFEAYVASEGLVKGTDYDVDYYIFALPPAVATHAALTTDGVLSGVFSATEIEDDTVIIETFDATGVPKFKGQITVESGINFKVIIPAEYGFTFSDGTTEMVFTPDAQDAFRSVEVTFSVNFLGENYDFTRSYNIFSYLAALKKVATGEEVELANRFSDYLYYTATAFGGQDAADFFDEIGYVAGAAITAPEGVKADATAHIKAATVGLTATPAFIFYVDAAEGNVTVSYTSLTGGTVTETSDLATCDVSADAGLDGCRKVVAEIPAYNFNSDVTVTFGEETLVYNLGDYIEGISGTDADFALALYAYAEAAHAYVNAE